MKKRNPCAFYSYFVRKAFLYLTTSYEEDCHPRHYSNYPTSSSWLSYIPAENKSPKHIYCSAFIQFGRRESIVDEKCIFTFANQITACHFLRSVKWILIEELYSFFLVYNITGVGGEGFSVMIRHSFPTDFHEILCWWRWQNMSQKLHSGTETELEKEPPNIVTHIYIILQMGEKCVKWYGAWNFMQSLKRTKTSSIHTKHLRFMLIFCFNYHYVCMSLFKRQRHSEVALKQEMVLE